MDRRAHIIRFGNDGWHARFDEDFTTENVVRVADALGLLWGDAHPGATVFVGYDTRHDARALAREIAGVLAGYGLDVRLSIGVSPTPAVGWACSHDASAIGGVVLTASERSCEYGGILVRMGDGGPASHDLLDQVEQLVPNVPTEVRGSYVETDFVGSYLADLALLVDGCAIAAARPRVVVDPMHGSGTDRLAEVLKGLGCVVTQIHGERSEDFGGIHPEPADPWADDCEQAVVSTGAELGVLLDGDGDRAALVDETGRILSPHELAPLMLGCLVEGHGKMGRVVTTLSCSASIVRQAERLGCEHVSVPVGFTRIYREMLEGDVLLGVEEYGGLSIPVHLRERDGLFVCLLAVELVARTRKPLSVLVGEMRSKIGRMCYTRRDVRMDSAATQAFRMILPGLNPESVAGRIPVEVSHADGLRLQFDDDSWVLMRPSRTDSVVRVYAEAPTEEERDALLEATCAIVRGGV